jgi:hypothetical protein
MEPSHDRRRVRVLFLRQYRHIATGEPAQESVILSGVCRVCGKRSRRICVFAGCQQEKSFWHKQTADPSTRLWLAPDDTSVEISRISRTKAILLLHALSSYMSIRPRQYRNSLLLRSCPFEGCHSDRSAAEWRNPLFLSKRLYRDGGEAYPSAPASPPVGMTLLPSPGRILDAR